MDDAFLIAFLRSQRWAVEATVSGGAHPQAAIVGYAVTDRFELVFDTLSTSRKATNLRANPRVALVIGGWQEGAERTLQYEGIADFPTGDDLAPLKRAYFDAFPDGPSRESWPGISYVRVKPVWLRFSDYTADPPKIVERSFADQGVLRTAARGTQTDAS